MSSNTVKDFNFGGYGQIGGTSLAFTVGTDGITLGIGGQLSVGYTVSGATNFNVSWNGTVSIQSQVAQGLGTPTGMPGYSVSVLQSVNSPTTQVQVGFGINDLLEVGATASVTKAVQPAYSYGTLSYNTPSYSLEGRNYPAYQTPSYSQAPNTQSYRSSNKTGTTLNVAELPINGLDLDFPAPSKSISDFVGPPAPSWYASDFVGPPAPSSWSASDFVGPPAPSQPVSEADFVGPPAPSTDTETDGYGYGYGYGYGDDGWGSSDGGWDAGRDGQDTGGWQPLVIDLDADGVEIKPLSTSGTYFDADSDDYRERTAWAGADDALLVIDLGGDGQITQSKEVALAQWTSEEDTDLQALASVLAANDMHYRRCA
jgi:hypothetical protein